MHSFWMMIYSHTAVSVAAGAATVTVLVQFVKMVMPTLINGKKAVLFTFATALGIVAAGHVASVYLGMNPPSFWSEAMLNQVLAIAATASAVHGTAKSLLGTRTKLPSWDIPFAGNAGSAANTLNTTGKDPQIQSAAVKS